MDIASERTYARLREVLRHWFTAAENYSDAEEFRIAINSCIQAVRNVTFILQKNKKHIENFDSWYKTWQTAMAADPIMRWCVDARNYVVKQGDLETHSVAIVALLNSHNAAREHIFSIDPRLSGKEVAQLIKVKFLPEQLSNYGFLQVERQWITKDLKGVELLSGLAHAFTVLNLLVEDIFTKNGPSKKYDPQAIEEIDFANAIELLDEDDKPKCMLAFEEYRKTNYNLSSGETITLSTDEIEFDPTLVPQLKEKYGDIKASIGEMGNTLEDRVRYHLELAKGILKADGYLLVTVAIFDSGDKPHMVSTMFENNEVKYLFWKDIAKRVRKLRARMIVTTGDSWRARMDKSNPLKLGKHVADLEEKDEMIMVCGMDRSGKVLTIGTPYTRKGETIEFGTDEKLDMKPSYLNPVLKAFRKLKWA